MCDVHGAGGISQCSANVSHRRDQWLQGPPPRAPKEAEAREFIRVSRRALCLKPVRYKKVKRYKDTAAVHEAGGSGPSSTKHISSVERRISPAAWALYSPRPCRPSELVRGDVAVRQRAVTGLLRSIATADAGLLVPISVRSLWTRSNVVASKVADMITAPHFIQ